MKKIFSSLLFCFLAVVGVSSQSNLLKTFSGTDAKSGWKAVDDAKIDASDADSVFVVRNKGSFHQIVEFDASMVGKYAVLIGRGSAERINLNGSITGLPYLYGYFLTKASAKRTIIGYLQGQSMRGNPKSADDWILMYGIFEVPLDTIAVQFSLNQAERRDDPQNGSAAKFRDIGLFVFDTKIEAEEFVGRYVR